MKTWTLSANIVLLTALLSYGLYQRTRAHEPEPIVPVKNPAENEKEAKKTTHPSTSAPSEEPENTTMNNGVDVPVDVAGFRNWESHLTQFMSERGFSEHEISRTAEVLGEKLKSETVDDEEISGALRQVARELKFDQEREELLASALYFALAESSGSISFQDWQNCVQQKLNEMNATSCLRSVVQSLQQKIRQQIEGDTITLSQTQTLAPLQNEAVDRAVNECGNVLDEVGPLLSFNDGPCRY